jgi:hypothetical protein
MPQVYESIYRNMPIYFPVESNSSLKPKGNRPKSPVREVSCGISTKHAGACRSAGSGHLLPVNDPYHNLREVVKQMILVEDHLFQADKQCIQCIHKHLLAIEALSEEGITLDATTELVKIFRNIIVVIRSCKRWLKNPEEAGQTIRALRRTLMDKVE